MLTLTFSVGVSPVITPPSYSFCPSPHTWKRTLPRGPTSSSTPTSAVNVWHDPFGRNSKSDGAWPPNPRRKGTPFSVSVPPSPAPPPPLLEFRSTGPCSFAMYVHGWSLRNPSETGESVPTTRRRPILCTDTLTLYWFANEPRSARAPRSRTVAIPGARSIAFQLTVIVAEAEPRFRSPTARAPFPARGLYQT